MPYSDPTDCENVHLILTGKEKMELHHRAVPTIRADEVLIKVMSTGM